MTLKGIIKNSVDKKIVNRKIKKLKKRSELDTEFFKNEYKNQRNYFFYLIEKGDEKLIKGLYKSFPDFRDSGRALDRNNNTIMHHLVRSKNFSQSLLVFLFEKYPLLIGFFNNDKKKPLDIAELEKNKFAIEYLKGKEKKTEDSLVETPPTRKRFSFYLSRNASGSLREALFRNEDSISRQLPTLFDQPLSLTPSSSSRLHRVNLPIYLQHLIDDYSHEQKEELVFATYEDLEKGDSGIVAKFLNSTGSPLDKVLLDRTYLEQAFIFLQNKESKREGKKESKKEGKKASKNESKKEKEELEKEEVFLKFQEQCDLFLFYAHPLEAVKEILLKKPSYCSVLEKSKNNFTLLSHYFFSESAIKENEISEKFENIFDSLKESDFCIFDIERDEKDFSEDKKDDAYIWKLCVEIEFNKKDFKYRTLGIQNYIPPHRIVEIVNDLYTSMPQTGQKTACYVLWMLLFQDKKNNLVQDFSFCEKMELFFKNRSRDEDEKIELISMLYKEKQAHIRNKAFIRTNELLRWFSEIEKLMEKSSFDQLFNCALEKSPKKRNEEVRKIARSMRVLSLNFYQTVSLQEFFYKAEKQNIDINTINSNKMSDYFVSKILSQPASEVVNVLILLLQVGKVLCEVEDQVGPDLNSIMMISAALNSIYVSRLSTYLEKINEEYIDIYKDLNEIAKDVRGKIQNEIYHSCRGICALPFPGKFQTDLIHQYEYEDGVKSTLEIGKIYRKILDVINEMQYKTIRTETDLEACLKEYVPLSELDCENKSLALQQANLEMRSKDLRRLSGMKLEEINFVPLDLSAEPSFSVGRTRSGSRPRSGQFGPSEDVIAQRRSGMFPYS